MEKKKYKIKYLPLFYNDLDQITDYIMYKLNNEIAANNFVNELENEINKEHIIQMLMKNIYQIEKDNIHITEFM